MTLPLYQVDAFTDRVFAGNPAAVCPLEGWLPDETLQAIAAENNVSETAFFVPDPGPEADFALRWFTPTTEVPLCGHATLASAFVLVTILEPERPSVRFSTKASGILTVSRTGDRLAMDFPAKLCHPTEPDPALNAALGRAPVALFGGPEPLAVYEREADVATLAPDFPALERLVGSFITVTAPGDTVDFVSRVFGPALGIPEDPATGAAHCLLAPYWAERLGRPALTGRQLSARGGEIGCRVVGDRVELSGKAALYLVGAIHV